MENGDEDLDAIHTAVKAAKNVLDKPSLIKVRTTIGYGAPLQDVEALKTKLGFNPKELYKDLRPRGEQVEAQWIALFADYAKQHKKDAEELPRIRSSQWRR